MINSRQRLWIRRVLTSIAVSIGCLAGWVGINCLPANRPRAIFGWHTMQVIEGADSVTLYRIKNDTHGHPIMSQALLVSPEETRRLKKMLSNPQSYAWRTEYMCMSVNTGLLMQFHRGSETVDARFGFGCRLACLGEPNGYNWIAYDPMWNQVVSLMKQSFPQDTEVRSLPLS